MSRFDIEMSRFYVEMSRFDVEMLILDTGMLRFGIETIKIESGVFPPPQTVETCRRNVEIWHCRILQSKCLDFALKCEDLPSKC